MGDHRWRRAAARAWDSDLLHDLRRSPAVMTAAALGAAFVAAAILAPWAAPHQVFDPGSVNLLDAATPPAWAEGGQARYPLGTDSQGRDVLSAILFGSRVSLAVGLSATALAMVLGVALGLAAGWAGGRLDAFLMRCADVQLSFPAILVALLVDGLAKSFLPRRVHDEAAFYVVVTAIALANWVGYARTVRASTLVERDKEYVQAARVLGRRPAAIVLQHILPNVLGPVLVIATLGLAGAILTEATLSFLGVGVSPTRPSLGTLIRNGNDFLLSGEWWMTIFPGAALVLLVLCINVLGDWLRDALDPKLR
ncbi:MAG TPA: ABC transporter permease [Anaeromyxobacteraceae bacterium]|nr:ABC transporter permease [Anaeromyxobacteraceae bacterium]